MTRGEVVGFLGPNGAGKTTTMKILTCFIAPSDGTARVAGADIFEDLFGRGGFRAKGADVSYTMSVGFVEAALGGRQRLKLSDGRDLELTIPPGTTDRETLRLKGQGLAGMGGGEPGDAYVEIRVEPHPHFRLDGRDIHLDLPVTLHEAVLGASIEVPTVAGAVKLKIPPGSNTGATLRLQGRGIPARGSSPRGHQFVHLNVVLPDDGDSELADFVKRWQPPPKVVRAFEQEGFIWGGKWYLFDTMHFEYRPEFRNFRAYFRSFPQ